LARTIARHGVTTAFLSTALFHVVVADAIDLLAPLRRVVVGGDVLAASCVRRAFEAHPHLTIVNGYGPTENTTFTTCHVMTARDAVDDPVPIGRPLDATSVHLLDASMRPVARGAIGALFTGGLGVAHGYVGDDARTRAAFVDAPFDGAGPTLHDTGDRARERDDGAYEFFGRVDDQVKVRGHRIALGDVEQALRAIDGVAEAAVVVEHHDAADKRLVAHVAGDVARLDARRVRAALRTSLPAFMIPTVVHVTRALPLTAHGKIDRQRLRDDGAIDAAV
jgi:acyl-coenzyme A synthetase/AMP-(fatty) acid ligase